MTNDIYYFLRDKVKEKGIVDIILEYKGQLEHREKFKKCLKELKYESMSCKWYMCIDNNNRTRYYINNEIIDLTFCKTCGRYFKVIHYNNSYIVRCYHTNCVLTEPRCNNYVIKYHYYHKNWNMVNYKRTKYNKYRDCDC